MKDTGRSGVRSGGDAKRPCRQLTAGGVACGSLLLTLLSATSAGAAVWTDPSFGRALRAADLVVRVQAPAAGSKAVPRVRFKVLATLKGRAPARVVVENLHDPTRCAGPTFAPREELYLVLLRRNGRYRVPTPTMGRFPVRGARVKFVALRDTFLRLELSKSDFERYVQLRLEHPDRAWLAGLRQTLRRTKPSARSYLALEALALAGDREDRDLVTPFLEPRFPYQLRISACRALRQVLGRRSAARLLRVAKSDPEAAVRTAAVRLLASISRRGLVRRLARLLPRAPEKRVLFVGPNDPRLNSWPSPKVALLRAIAARGAAPAKPVLLALLRGAPRLEVLEAVLSALMRLRKDARLPGELIARFKGGAGANDGLFNSALCAALTRLTGEKLGDDPARWRSWLARR